MNLAQAKKLKTGQRVRYVWNEPDFGDEGTVCEVYATGVDIRWDTAKLYYPFRNDAYHFRNLELLK